MAARYYKTLKINIEEKNLNFSLAKHECEKLASTIIQGPMVVAWFDGKKGVEHPSVPECQHKPGWLAYADGHDGCLRVDVNDNEYSFIFSESGITED